MMQDITASLPSNGPWPQERTHTESIVIHHSATSATTSPQAIADYHVKTKGMPRIQYHALVYWNGDVFQTNVWDDLVYHAGCGFDSPKNANSFAIGVCLVGDFTDHHPTDAQLAAFRELKRDLEAHYRKELSLLGHKECYGVLTRCPGDTWNEWQAQCATTAPPPTNPLTAPRWAVEEAVRGIEDALTLLQNARTRLIDDVITPLYKLEGGQ